MHSSLFCISVFFLTFLIVFTQSTRVADQMYVSFDRARYCVRHLNGTHEIGCQSSMRGNSGRMYMIDNENEFNSYLKDSKTIDSSNSFIIALNIELFNSEYVDKLMNRLDSKLNGLVIYLKSNLSRPKDFSHDDQCPNHRQSYYLNQTETVHWNPKGTGLFFRSFPFPIVLLDEKDDYERLDKFYRQFYNTQSSPTCGLEVKAFQSAAHTSKTCMRRNEISHSLLDAVDGFCDPVGGLNIYSKLPDSLTLVPKQRQPKSVVLILATTDSFQMFLKAQGTTGGAQQPATALITFLALAHVIGQEQKEFNKQDKEIIFVTLDGDALDYSASFRFLFDMNNDYFPAGDKNEQRIKIEHIHSIIEFQSLSFSNNLSLYAYPSSPSIINETFIATLLENNPMITRMNANSPLPPASSQIFQQYNTTTEFSQWIKSIVEPLAQTLLDSYVGNNITNVTIEQEIINNLVYCVLKNVNCPLIHNVSNQSIGNSFDAFEQTSLPFSINTYPTATTPTFPFVQNILSYFLRDREYDKQNITETKCLEQKNNDTLRLYRYVGGYAPSIMPEQNYSGYCVRSYLRYASSSSPAFSIDNYDLSQTTYPAWTESRWTTFTLRLFIIPTRTHEIVTLVIGILLLSISFIVFSILRWYVKLDLLQPSSS
ncbi:unnamed protein product [Adineta steineri]|uniref:Nicastrin n=1 Tax=Adineta steineri TaxID=433720 RepID=A0A815D4E7_9BILA|nr:unnamed protein product [Adineta steineri]CAF1569351.1 unnamed protein product [Adineta steineri]